MAATIKDVARLAGVSPSTVSRVLNQKGVISEETKQKIASAMEQLKYVPNDIARSFANGSAHAISLVIDISDGTAYANNFFNNTVFGIETAAHQNDYNLIITNGAAAFGGISSIERLIAGKKVDGVVLPISLVTDELLRRIEDLSVPCVILGRSEEVGAEANWVDINNVQAGRRAVRLLLERGYKKIAFLSDGDQRFNRDRIAGYRRAACRKSSARSDGGILLPARRPSRSGMDCVRAFFGRQRRAPDAVILQRRPVGAKRIAAARQLGLRVPEQFGIISCDNTPPTELAETPITSVWMWIRSRSACRRRRFWTSGIEDPQTVSVADPSVDEAHRARLDNGENKKKRRRSPFESGGYHYRSPLGIAHPSARPPEPSSSRRGGADAELWYWMRYETDPVKIRRQRSRVSLQDALHDYYRTICLHWPGSRHTPGTASP